MTVQIVEHKVPTVDELRERTHKVMAKTTTTRTDCSKCGGRGYVEKSEPMSQSDVARALGIHVATLNAFLKGRGGMSLEKGLTIMRWLEEQDRAAPRRIDDPDETDADREPRSPTVREQSRERLAAMQRHASAMAASAGIDSINRPLVMKK